jgi:A/G-specific adenine glycosylase
MAQKSKRREDAAKQTRSAQIKLPEAGFISDLQEEVLQWYVQNGRDLPWRHTRDPYKILVSELMLQQTQAPRVIPKYDAFIVRFPDVGMLAEAPLGEVLTYWSGLGYNRRAQYLHRAAQYLAAEHGGEFPKNPEALLNLPGVGPYTAGAIAAFAFNLDVVILETNIRRIYQLLFSGEDASDATNSQVAAALLPSGHARDWYHALMDLATEIRSSSSAAAQQQRLRELFPLLAEHNFPQITADRLERPRQSTFAGSHRFFRGQILKRLQVGPLSQSRLFDELEIGKVSAALQELIKEGLVTYEPFDDSYRLP